LSFIGNPNITTEWIDQLKSVQICCFCNRTKKRHRCKGQKLISAVTTQQRVEIRGLLNPMTDEIFAGTSLKYHLMCLNEFKQIHKQTNIASKQIVNVRKNIHLAALKEINLIVKETIINSKSVRPLKDIYKAYDAIFDGKLRERNESATFNTYKPRILKDYLLKTFPDLRIIVVKNRTFLHEKTAKKTDVIVKAIESEELSDRISSVANEIRKVVFNMDKSAIPRRNISIKDIENGECEIPKELFQLIRTLIGGPHNETLSERKLTRIKSISSSLIFSICNCKVKPSWCISLGLVMKSITSSKKVVDILNRLGHCLNYSAVEEFETELAYNSSADGTLLPEGIQAKHPELHTHVAFDNNDRYVETQTGKNTLHDTVGIIYQNIETIDNAPLQCGDILQIVQTNSNEESIEIGNQRSRRAYKSNLDVDIQPYVRGSVLLSKFTGERHQVPNNLSKVIEKDRLWMMCNSLKIKGFKRWVAWNSERTFDVNPVHRIAYLPQINSSPTNDATVKKTMEIASRIRNECEQKYIIVTYDLAIVPKAIKIQNDLSPQFDELFISIGSFHVEMSFFKAIGKFIDSSGLPAIIISSGLLAPGSLKGVISGCHFNRCKNIHMTTALALKSLHFKEFLKFHFQNDDVGKLLLIESLENGCENEVIYTAELAEVLNAYNQYYDETLNGGHGLTAKYMLLYVYLIDMYLIFERSIRTCDLELYICTFSI
jgi:ribosomal protein S8E